MAQRAITPKPATCVMTEAISFGNITWFISEEKSVLQNNTHPGLKRYQPASEVCVGSSKEEDFVLLGASTAFMIANHCQWLVAMCLACLVLCHSVT